MELSIKEAKALLSFKLAAAEKEAAALRLKAKNLKRSAKMLRGLATTAATEQERDAAAFRIALDALSNVCESCGDAFDDQPGNNGSESEVRGVCNYCNEADELDAAGVES